MKSLFGAGLIFALVGAGETFAAPQTVKLAVDGMSCASCPYQVEAVLKKISGVVSAEASLEDKSVRVTYDDAKADIAALTGATASAGFPSRLAEAKQ